MQGTNRRGQGERRAWYVLCDPGSELRLGGREHRRAKTVNGMEKKKKKKSLRSRLLLADFSRQVGWKVRRAKRAEKASPGRGGPAGGVALEAPREDPAEGAAGGENHAIWLHFTHNRKSAINMT